MEPTVIKFLFTKKTIDQLPIPSTAEAGSTGYTAYWDSKLSGFGVFVRPTGLKTFVLSYRDRLGKAKRLTIGRFGRLTVEQARDAAALNNGRVALGQDPMSEK